MVWNPEEENICPKNKNGHNFSIEKGEDTYCQYCGVNQNFCCNPSKEYIEVQKR